MAQGREQLMRLKKDALCKKCKRLKLSTTGSKQEMVERILKTTNGKHNHKKSSINPKKSSNSIHPNIISLDAITNINGTLPTNLKNCTSYHLISLITNHQSFKDEAINPFKTTITKYIKVTQIDGQILSNTTKKKFTNALMKYSQNKNIKHAANKLYQKLTKLEFPSINV